MGDGSGGAQTAGRLRLSALHSLFNGAAGWPRQAPRSGLVQQTFIRRARAASRSDSGSVRRARRINAYSLDAETNMDTVEKAKIALLSAWPKIKEECLSVFGSELHYQAMVYHCLRDHGPVPVSQLGTNVKIWIDSPRSRLFKSLDKKKHKDYQGGFEPIPDVVIFHPSINSDWRRRNRDNTLTRMLISMEVKASERSKSRLQPGEIVADIEKLAALREEVEHKGSKMFPVIVVIDSAPLDEERMTSYGKELFVDRARELEVGVLYCSQEPSAEVNTIKKHLRRRASGCPEPPPQTRTCSIPASGSSVALAFARATSFTQTPVRVAGSATR